MTARRKTAGSRAWPRSMDKKREVRDAPDLRERLRRALFIIPYAVAHRGCTVEELAAAARLSPDELIARAEVLGLMTAYLRDGSGPG